MTDHTPSATPNEAAKRTPHAAKVSVADAFRKTQSPLSPLLEEKVSYLKVIGENVFDILDTHTTGNTDLRLLNNAKDQLEIAIMLAVKVVTGP